MLTSSGQAASFMRCLTLLPAETTLYPHLLFMVEHIIFLQ